LSSVKSRTLATETAFSSAVRTTFVGSTRPGSTRSIFFLRAASKPKLPRLPSCALSRRRHRLLNFPRSDGQGPAARISGSQRRFSRPRRRPLPPCRPPRGSGAGQARPPGAIPRRPQGGVAIRVGAGMQSAVIDVRGVSVLRDRPVLGEQFTQRKLRRL